MLYRRDGFRAGGGSGLDGRQIAFGNFWSMLTEVQEWNNRQGSLDGLPHNGNGGMELCQVNH